MALFPKRYVKEVEKFRRNSRSPRKPKHSITQMLARELDELSYDPMCDWDNERDDYSEDEYYNPYLDVEWRMSIDDHTYDFPVASMLYTMTYSPWGLYDIDEFLSFHTNYNAWIQDSGGYICPMCFNMLRCCALMEYIINSGGWTTCCLIEISVNLKDTVFWIKMLRMFVMGAESHGIHLEHPTLSIEIEDMYENFDDRDTNRYYNYCVKVFNDLYSCLFRRIEVVIC